MVKEATEVLDKIKELFESVQPVPERTKILKTLAAMVCAFGCAVGGV